MVIHFPFYTVLPFLISRPDWKYLKLLKQFVVRKIILIGIICELFTTNLPEKRNLEAVIVWFFVPLWSESHWKEVKSNAIRFYWFLQQQVIRWESCLEGGDTLSALRDCHPSIIANSPWIHGCLLDSFWIWNSSWWLRRYDQYPSYINPCSLGGLLLF